MRPTRHQTYLEIAHTWSKRSTCHRLNVGAVIVSHRTIISHGYNGSPPGYAHCIGNDCPGKLVCKETIHAEVNAIIRCPTDSLRDADMYCTDSPCADCAHIILNAGIRRVFFSVPYRITESLDWLAARDVEVYRVTSAGYVIEWRSKDVVEVAT